jgi:hypothetical protein
MNTRNEIKVSFLDPTFNCKDRSVECIVYAHLLVPDSLNKIVNGLFPGEDVLRIRGRGLANCLDRDAYDEKTGKRIAKLKAEQDVLIKAGKILNRICKSMLDPAKLIGSFEAKLTGCINHNIEYYQKLCGND